MKASNVIHHCLCGFLSVMLFSCVKTQLPVNEYNKWVEDVDNDLKQVKEIGNIQYSLQYKPLDYILNREEVLKENRAERLEEIRGMHYFQLTINRTDKPGANVLKNTVASNSDHQQALYYFSYLFNENIILLEGNDTLKCDLYHFVRDNGLSPELNFVFGFERGKQETDRQLIIIDDFFKNGPVKFNYSHELLTNLPTINFTEL